MNRFQDSFDDRAHTGGGQVSAKYSASAVDNGGVMTLINGIAGMTNKCLYIQGNSAYLERTLLDNNGNAVATDVFWFAMRWRQDNAGPYNNKPIVQFKDGSTVHLYIQRNTGNPAATLSVYRGDGTLLGTTVDTVEYNITSHLQFGAVIHNSAGSFELRINGINVLSASGIDTQNGGNASIDRFRIGDLVTSSSWYYDDITFNDDAGTYNNTWPGNHRITYHAPNAAGTYSDFTRTGGGSNNYEAVDDLSPDDASTFNSSPNVGDKDSFGVTNMSDNTVTVKVMTVQIRYKKDDSLSRKIKAKLITTGENNLLPELEATTSWQTKYIVVEEDPETTDPFVGSDIDACEIGYEVTT